jgi:membrane protein required for colicin V production
MNLLDLLLFAIVAGSVIAGLISGFTRAAFSIVATIAGILLGFWFYDVPAGWYEGWVGKTVANMFGFLTVLFIVGLIGTIAGRLVSGAFKVVGLGFADRLAGGAFGLVRGIFAMAAAVAVLVAATPRPVPNWMRGSTLLPYALGASDLISSLAPKALKDSVSSSIGELKNSWNEEVQRAKNRAEKALTPDQTQPKTETMPEPRPAPGKKAPAKAKTKVPKKAPPKPISQ